MLQGHLACCSAVAGGARLPAETIRPVARADRATTTWLLSSYLDSMGVGWVLGVAKAVNWPTCVHRVKGVADLLSYMGNTTYAAG
jgi:ABC-type phosphate transport system substrate-binding protein